MEPSRADITNETVNLCHAEVQELTNIFVSRHCSLNRIAAPTFMKWTRVDVAFCRATRVSMWILFSRGKQTFPLIRAEVCEWKHKIKQVSR